jgi:HlyD family secretion protein
MPRYGAHGPRQELTTVKNLSHKNTLVLHGNIDIREAELAFTQSERIASMEVQEGDRVKVGELLAELDRTRFQHAVDQADAQVEAQRQRLAALEAGTRPQELRRLKAEMEAAAIEAENARKTARRQANLVKQHLASQEQADDAAASADAAAARLRAAKEALALAVAGPRKEDIEAARATLKAYEAQLATAQQNLRDSRLYAPSDGVIRNRLLEPGDMASPQQPVYTLALTQPLWVRTYVDEPDLGKVRPGMRAVVHTDSFPGKAYQGWVGYISPTAEFTPKSVETREVRTHLVYQVRVNVCNPEGELRLGMPATVTLSLESPSSQPSGPIDCGKR